MRAGIHTLGLSKGMELSLFWTHKYTYRCCTCMPIVPRRENPSGIMCWGGTLHMNDNRLSWPYLHAGFPTKVPGPPCWELHQLWELINLHHQAHAGPVLYSAVNAFTLVLATNMLQAF